MQCNSYVIDFRYFLIFTLINVQLLLQNIFPVLSADSKARRIFTEHKALQFLQELLSKSSTSKDAKDAISHLNSVFPEEAVKFYTPNYDKKLLETIKDTKDPAATGEVSPVATQVIKKK